MIRKPAVAGTFYPGQPEVLRSAVEHYLAAAQRKAERRPKALIVPHAGYLYSGPVAASAYATLQPFRDTINKVVLLGPSHRIPFRGLALSSAAFFATPLGNIPIDRDNVDQLRAFDGVDIRDDAHAAEHSLEVQLPFLQVLLPAFTLTPIAVGDDTEQHVCTALETVWGGPETLVVVSTDLSHYHPYQTCRKMDSTTSKAITELDTKCIQGEHACGYVPMKGLLRCVQNKGLSVTCIDLRNSGDTAGPRDEVVGYGSYVIT